MTPTPDRARPHPHDAGPDDALAHRPDHTPSGDDTAPASALTPASAQPPTVPPTYPPRHDAPRTHGHRRGRGAAGDHSTHPEGARASHARRAESPTPEAEVPASHRRRFFSLRGVIDTPRAATAVLVVTLASGVLFAFSAVNARTTAQPDADLESLVRHRQAVVTDLDQVTKDLTAEVETALARESVPTETPDAGTSTSITSSALTGPGVTVTLTDAPGPAPEGVDPDLLVIHQQDIEDVMNALWSGGAEAMTVQGVRVTSRTVIRCIGNVILVDGASFSPPYEISAIGDPDALKAAVNADPRIINYKAYVAVYGLGWKMDSKASLDVPAAPQGAALQYAKVIDSNG